MKLSTWSEPTHTGSEDPAPSLFLLYMLHIQHCDDVNNDHVSKLRGPSSSLWLTEQLCCLSGAFRASPSCPVSDGSVKTLFARPDLSERSGLTVALALQPPPLLLPHQ